MTDSISSGSSGKRDYIRFDAERAIQYSNLPFPTRLLLFVMWTLADARTGVINRQISMTELATRTGMTKRSVVNHVAIAEKAGWLVRSIAEHPMRDKDANRYLLVIPANVNGSSAGDAPTSVQEMHPLGERDSPTWVNEVHTVINKHCGSPTADAAVQPEITTPRRSAAKIKSAPKEEEQTQTPAAVNHPEPFTPIPSDQMNQLKTAGCTCSYWHVQANLWEIECVGKECPLR